ncbi:MAG: UDP-N-acetylmuramoyl-L-alanine--D-glutamate ligase [Oscillospiraceae bacterium]|jgi:UDP-N-acetylmuramoylalanine--D-glutamate ligase|nr:UDP-N-acetylmuramoyl-L-alanine--D-glutamate ligase [Oscillospiraceae bacterium]MCI1990226.1 UDP-N-acetylmuramoyl-L-alanine--D-glutamate ligase [Oscillospiraceae bacterium]MCI2036288.1 UDP-N-acetylmuramoyl-L-alanine--D-glutamate ligase [Oscillospiraceae bacterium]
MTAEEFYRSVKGKTAAFCGLGGSNLPLVRLFAKHGAAVTARDRRPEDKLGAAAKKLKELGVRLVTGEGYLDNLDEEIIFRTPGMKYHLPQLDAARARGAAVTSEMEVFFDLCPCKIVAVTGSDGKTTTTTIISKILEAAGKKVHVGGNIGSPLLPRIGEIGPDDLVAAELSSFQLISMRRSPDVAVVTNVSPNHLDIHKDMQEYIGAKKNIILHQNAFGRAVLNADNKVTASFTESVRGQCLLFSRRHPVKYGAWMDGSGEIFLSLPEGRIRVMNASDIRIPGLHNIENYLAAVCAVWGIAGADDIAGVARTFPGVEHRNEFVRKVDGVSYYNDSIGTTPSRTINGALSLFDRKILLIAGGYDKNIPFDPLGPAVVKNVKTLVLIGATAPKIEAAVKAAPGYRDGNPKILHASSLEEAVGLCRANAQSGDVVSLSPACASFDMFPNFETRGERFREIVNGLKEK